MKIAQLKNDYPNIRFYELKEAPTISRPLMKNLEDFLDIVHLVGYVEILITKEEARETYLDFLVDLCLQNILKEENLSNKHSALMYNYKAIKENFISFMEESCADELEKLISSKAYTLVELYGIDCNIGYIEDDIKDNSNLECDLQEIDDLFKKYKQKLTDEQQKEANKQKERNNEIISLIMSYKEEYLKSRTKAEKENIIKKVKLHLKNEFGLDSRGDTRASKVFIEMQYEGK